MGKIIKFGVSNFYYKKNEEFKPLEVKSLNGIELETAKDNLGNVVSINDAGVSVTIKYDKDRMKQIKKALGINKLSRKRVMKLLMSAGVPKRWADAASRYSDRTEYVVMEAVRNLKEIYGKEIK